MQFFQELGALIGTRWDARGRDELAFAGIAGAALEELPPHRHATPDDVVRWATVGSPLPRQADIGSVFGQPAITVYSGHPLFHIDVLFWVDGTTSVHQHAFSGAFGVFAGSSIHSRYRFETEERVSSRLLFGRVDLVGAELLRMGDVRGVPAGKGFIHSLFHLERPSVSIVVRTYGDKEAQPQYRYRKPSIAFDPFFADPATVRRLQVLQLLQQTRPEEYERVLEELLPSCDVASVLAVLDQAFEHTREARFDELLELARPSLGARVERVAMVYQSQRLEHAIFHRRHAVEDADHRFFMALLLNLRDRRSILELIRARHRDREPVELAMEWIEALWNTRVMVQGDPFKMQTEDFWFPGNRGALGEESLLVLRELLEGRGGDEDGEVRRALEGSLLRPLLME